MGVCRDLPPPDFESTGLLIEFMLHGSLYSILHDDSDLVAVSRRPITLQAKLQMALDIAEGMMYLHLSNYFITS